MNFTIPILPPSLGMRMVVITLCVLAMLDLRCEVTRHVSPKIVIAVDDSASTQCVGETFDADAVAAALRKHGVSDVVVRRLSEDETNASPLGDWLREVGSEFDEDDESPSLLVFVSDGIVTHGAPLDSVSLASPVVCVAVGSDTAPADIAWVTPLILRNEDSSWRVIAQLRAIGQRAEREVVLKLVTVHSIFRHSRVLGGNLDNAAQADAPATFAQVNPTALALAPRRVRGGDEIEIERKHITIPVGDSRHSWTITIPARDADAAFLVVECDDVVDDIADNNRIQVDIPRERRVVRTLLIDRAPRPEYRFIRETLRRLDECDLQAVLIGAGDLTAELAASSDLVIVGDVDLDSLPNEVAVAIKSRPRILIAGVETATGEETSPLEISLTDDPLVPTLRESGRFDVRWSVPLDAAPESRVLATVGGRPLIVLDEDRRICFHATDELYRAAGVWGVEWWREYWRRIVVYIGEGGRRDAAQHGRVAPHTEFQNLKRDTAALNLLAAQNSGFVIDANSTTPDDIATKIVSRVAFDRRVRVALIPAWSLFTAAIAILFATWWRESRRDTASP